MSTDAIRYHKPAVQSSLRMQTIFSVMFEHISCSLSGVYNTTLQNLWLSTVCIHHWQSSQFLKSAHRLLFQIISCLFRYCQPWLKL